MICRVQEIEGFTVIGQSVELTNFQQKNISITTEFWRTFNYNLKKNYLSQGGNWVKYSFMERHEDKLFYFCAIPKRMIIPDGFIEKKINEHTYLVVQHHGATSKIYDTYSAIYKTLLPNSDFIAEQKEFLHFEIYDYKFHWNEENSIIEIWIPVKRKQNC